MKLIPLTQGKFAKVDDEDFEKLSIAKWFTLKIYNTFYARSKFKGKKVVYMHRIILGLKNGDGIIIDHINGDGLDNRKINLRKVTQRVNLQNTHSHREGKIVGARIKSNGKYESTIYANGSAHYLGVFPTAREASKVYKEYANAL